MMFAELQLKIQNAKDLDFGDIFSKSIELFKKTWVQGFVMLLLTMLLIVPFYIIIWIPIIAMGIFSPEGIEQTMPTEEILMYMLPFYLLVFAFSFFLMIIGFGMKASFYRICRIKDFNEATKDDYFYYFKKPYLGKTIKLSLATVGINLLALLLCYFPIIYVSVPIALINVIYAFNPDLTISNIIKLGFELGNKKWLITFGLVIVAGLLAQFGGLLLCGIGVFATVSFTYLPPYFIYKEVIGFDEKDDIMKIGDE